MFIISNVLLSGEVIGVTISSINARYLYVSSKGYRLLCLLDINDMYKPIIIYCPASNGRGSAYITESEN